MAKLCPLFSGSKANCTYISSSNEAVLVDAGASLKATLNAIEEIGEDIEKIRAILITHEHGDHIRGLKALAKRLQVPIIASKQTLEALMACGGIDSTAELLEINSVKELDFCRIERFETMHDCEGSSGFSILMDNDVKATVCTDLGVVTATVREAIIKSSIIVLESNHDLQMLQKGPYPPELKLRIAGDRGHLSNAACAGALVELVKNGTNRFVLAHLSENNNLPTIAMRTSQSALLGAGAKIGKDYLMYCAEKTNREVIYF